MIVTFFWNYLNLHQVPIADAMYDLLGDNFRFVATMPRNEKELKGGADYNDRPYCVLAGESEEAHKRAMMSAEVADVCVFGACSQEYAIHRATLKPESLSFECGERWLKRGWLNILSPVLRQWWVNYMRYYRKANFYKLCSSAFAAQDDEKLGCYKNRHFKWGYFTSVGSYDDDNNSSSKTTHSVRIMWCARMIDWKHPELAVECAKRMKADGYKFQLDLYGDGIMRQGLEKDVASLGLSEFVKFHGNVPNEEIQEAMRTSDIFLFTSDRQEGWGAVANEAMAAGCLLIGSDEIGAVPYLVNDGYTGLIFKSRNLESLYEKTVWAIEHQNDTIVIRNAAKEALQNIWSPQNAAKSLLTLIDNLMQGKDTPAVEGPCSKA